jgi:hypothetical protein
MKQSISFGFTFLCLFFFNTSLTALVKYDEGRLQIDGIQLLQDKDEPTSYYYIPQYPKVSTKEDGSLEFLCIKYIGQEGSASNGGIFHALIEFSLPEEVLESLEQKLKKIIPDGIIVGPVPLLQTMKNGEEGLAGFSVVSSILNDTGGENPFTQTVITSGHAPLLPGSKAAIAAKLSQEGATLLWESLQGPTSDVSIAISGYYEAYVKAYNAIVTAEVDMVYEHFSKIKNLQQGFTRDQLRQISDELVQNNVLNIEAFDRSALGVKTDDMADLLNLITNKLIALMFDAKTGWAQKPETEVAVEQGQIQGRQQRGWFSRVFGGARNEQYVSDDQFVIKSRKDIRSHKFYLNLSQATTIKVPIYTSGNIGGLFFESLGQEERYFKVVNLDDPDFQKRSVHFQVDGRFAESFRDIINFVSVSFKKSYGDQHSGVTKDLIFKKSDLENGGDVQMVEYPRLGLASPGWLSYDYRLSWSFKGSDQTIMVPSANDEWLKASEPAISLIPPFEKRIVIIDADRSFFSEAGYKTASIRFFVILNDKPQLQRNIILRAGDAENSRQIALYHDTEEPVIYQLTWHSKDGSKKEDPKELSDDYLFLIPPN